MNGPIPNATIDSLDLDTLYYVRESFVGLNVMPQWQGWYDPTIRQLDEIIKLRLGPQPSPHDLWKQAEGDPDRYVALMVAHGHLVHGSRKPGTDIFGHEEHI